MMQLANRKSSILTALLLAAAPCFASELESVDGPNVRTMKQEDGSRAVFVRSPDGKTLTKKTFSANGVLTLVTTYKMDANGNPRGCKIRDGMNDELFKVSYGYNKATGQLVDELMYDSRVKQINSKGEEIPVQRLIYLYDAEGKRSAPYVYNFRPGKTYEQAFGAKPGYSSALEKDPFKNSKR